MIDEFDTKELSGKLEPGQTVAVYDRNGTARRGRLVHVYLDGDVLVDYGNGERDTVFRDRVMLEAEQDDLDFKDLLSNYDFKDLLSNYEAAKAFVEEHLNENKGLWELASYSKFHGGAAGKANVRYFQERYPDVTQTRGCAAYGEETVGIPEEKLNDLDAATMASIYRDLNALTKYPILDEGFYAEAEREGQEKAWSGWIKQQFMSALYSQYPALEDRLWALKSEQEHDLFESLRDWAGAEWTEDSDGEQVVDLDDILDPLNETVLREHLNRLAGPEQLQLNLEELINGDGELHWLAETAPRGFERRLRRVISSVYPWTEQDAGAEYANEEDPELTDHIVAFVLENYDQIVQSGAAEDWAHDAVEHAFLAMGWHLGHDRSQRELELLTAAIARCFGVVETLQEGRQFSCVMAPAPDDLADYLLRWGQMNVQDDEIYDNEQNDFGREDEPHVTVKFGLHDARPSEALLKIIESTQPFEITVGPVSFFESEDYDVLKFGIEGDGLIELNRRISEEIECTDTHPEYHPHLTMAYVQKGCCRELEGKLLKETDDPAELRFLVKTITFSAKDKNKYTLFLGKPNEIIDGTGPTKESLEEAIEDDNFKDLMPDPITWDSLPVGTAVWDAETETIEVKAPVPDQARQGLSGLVYTYQYSPAYAYGKFVQRYARQSHELAADVKVLGQADQLGDLWELRQNLSGIHEAFQEAGPTKESLEEAQDGTVVIHLDDRSTDFLKPIYEGKGYPVVNGAITPDELAKVIKEADRLYMIGHGSPSGLFGSGFMIGDKFGPLLAEKRDGVYVWCNADAYAMRHGLTGLVSGMFISEVGEARLFNIQATQEEVDASNDAFARIVREVIDRGDPYSMIRQCYAASNAACKITQFNAERLYVFEAGKPTPALHASSAHHEEERFRTSRAEFQALRAREDEAERRLLALRPQLAAAAQAVYDAWEQDEEGIDVELGAGGICQDIAGAMADVLSSHGIEATTVDTSVGDQHVWVMANIEGLVFSVDIPPHAYESGSGYVWQKRRGVEFEPEDVYISPEDVSWEDIMESMDEAKGPFYVLLMARYDGKYVLQYDEGRFRISDDNQGRGYTHQEAQAKADEIRLEHGFSYDESAPVLTRE